LFETSLELSKAVEDLDNKQKQLNAIEATRLVLKQLQDHSKNEDVFLHPLYEERSNIPELGALARRLSKEHEELEPYMKSIHELAYNKDLQSETVTSLYKVMNSFVSMYLRHIEGEESSLPLIWRSYSDDELGRIFNCFLATKGSAEHLKAVQSFWSTIPEQERKRLRYGMEANSPVDLFSVIKQALE